MCTPFAASRAFLHGGNTIRCHGHGNKVDAAGVAVLCLERMVVRQSGCAAGASAACCVLLERITCMARVHVGAIIHGHEASNNRGK